MPSAGPGRPVLDVSVAHPARRCNYWLGGKDNFQADRESANAIEAIYPYIRTAAVQNRRFLQRVVQYLVEEAGVRQFLDVGTGLPTADNTHEIAQRIDPGARVVYVDNDPLVLIHARALLTSHPAGRTAYVEADLTDPQRILTDTALATTLNMDEPVALLLLAVLHFLPDTEAAYRVVKTLTGGLPTGSYLAVSHATDDYLPAETAEAFWTKKFDFTSRNRAQVDGFVDGLDVIPPGVTVGSQWRNPQRSATAGPRLGLRRPRSPTAQPARLHRCMSKIDTRSNTCRARPMAIRSEGKCLSECCSARTPSPT